MGWPQVTALGAGHAESHTQALSWQRWPLGQATPRPQAGPPSQALGISRPQPTWDGSMWSQRGAQAQRPLTQRSPEGQRVPAPLQEVPGHASGSDCPQATVSGRAQAAPHTQRLPSQSWPAGHWLPRLQAGCPAQRLAMGVPQATVLGSVLGQAGMHAQAPFSQRSCDPQRVPVPGQLAPVQALRMASPQVTVSAGGHDGMHTQAPLVQRLPLGQRVPVPQAGASGQRLRTVCPQATSPGLMAGHAGTHWQARASVSQRCPGAQP